MDFEVGIVVNPGMLVTGRSRKGTHEVSVLLLNLAVHSFENTSSRASTIPGILYICGQTVIKSSTQNFFKARGFYLLLSLSVVQHFSCLVLIQIPSPLKVSAEPQT